MGSDILLVSPCCRTEDYTLVEGISKTCPQCKGHKVIWLSVHGEAEKDICPTCDGNGIVHDDTYECLHCGSEFRKPIEDVIDYNEDAGQDR